MDENSHSPSVTLSSLLCKESDHILDDEDDTFIDLGIWDGFSDDDYHIKMLFEREISFGFTTRQKDSLSPTPCFNTNWLKFARLEAISWTLKNRATFGFHLQSAYLSMTYFDRFLAMRAIDSDKIWVIRLLSVACLSLAAKMEECKVPGLSEFEVEEYIFESKVIQRMELLVLSTLEWRMNLITPFSFIHYFIRNFTKESPPIKIVSRTNQIILTIMREINLMHFKPSVMAAAAALVALDQKLSIKELECKINDISPCGFLEIEDVYSCYDLMLKLEISKYPIQNSIMSPELSPSHPSLTGRIENNSIVSTKRKRLILNDCEEDHKEKR